MVKIERKETEKTKQAIVDLQKASENESSYRKKGYFGTDEKLEFTSVGEEREDVKNTIALLEAAYYGTTPQKKIEAQIIRKTLRQNLSNFKEYVREYQETEDKEEKEDIGYLLKKELRDSSAFAAFKRWLIWDNEMFSEIEQFIPEN